jgi:hypothetical protein
MHVNAAKERLPLRVAVNPSDYAFAALLHQLE